MPLLVHHFSTLYCTFTNENWSALLELLFLAYLFTQLLSVSSSCLKSSAQEVFLGRVGRQKDLPMTILSSAI